MYGLLQETINRYVRFSDQEKQLFSDQWIYREVPEQFRLVDIGKTCREIYFLNKGCVRLYYLKNGEEVSGFLFTEGMFLNSFESFISETASLQIVETIEPCELLVLSKTKLDQLYLDLPKTNILFRKILEERFVNAQKLVATFIMDKPVERYLGILKSNPILLQRFPLQVLATYLGITPVSLSRIRKRLADQ